MLDVMFGEIWGEKYYFLLSLKLFQNAIIFLNEPAGHVSWW